MTPTLGQLVSLVPLLILILDVFVIIQIAKSGMDMGKKIIWIIVVLLLPLLGPILYYLLNKS